MRGGFEAVPAGLPVFLSWMQPWFARRIRSEATEVMLGDGISHGRGMVGVTTRQRPSGVAKPRIWCTNHGSCGVFAPAVPTGLLRPHTGQQAPGKCWGRQAQSPGQSLLRSWLSLSSLNPLARGTDRPLLPSHGGWDSLVTPSLPIKACLQCRQSHGSPRELSVGWEIPGRGP